MKTSQKGFNLLELIIAMIVIGTLGAIAIPKIIDLSKREKLKNLKEMASQLSEASKTNYKLKQTKVKKPVSISNCTDITKLLIEGLPKGYMIEPKPTKLNAETECTLKGPNNSSASFTIRGT